MKRSPCQPIVIRGVIWKAVILSLQMMFQKEEEKELHPQEKGTLRESLPKKVTTYIENMSILAKKKIHKIKSSGFS